MRDRKTKFPQYIDDRIFFQDINLTQTPIMNYYYSLLDSGSYAEASEFLNDSEVFFYGAWLLNLLEERLHAIGDYLIKLPPKTPLVKYQSESPVPADEETHWLSSEKVPDDSGAGTWKAVSDCTWEQLSDYTWEQIKDLNGGTIHGQ